MPRQLTDPERVVVAVIVTVAIPIGIAAFRAAEAAFWLYKKCQATVETSRQHH